MNNIIDIGSNSVRMYTNGEKTIITTLLAENMVNGMLDNASIQRTVNAIKTLCAGAKGRCFAFATEAVRNAANKEEFLFSVKQHTGLSVDVLSGEEEGEISFLGATYLYGAQTARVIDLGGASCETTQGKNGQIAFSTSFPFGCVTLKDKFGDNLIEIERYVIKLYSVNDFKVDINVAVGGTATALAAMDMNLSSYDSNKVDGHMLYSHIITNLINELKGGKEFPTLSPNRRKTILQGAAALRAMMGVLQLNKIKVSEKDNLEGYAIKHKLM